MRMQGGQAVRSRRTTHKHGGRGLPSGIPTVLLTQTCLQAAPRTVPRRVPVNSSLMHVDRVPKSACLCGALCVLAKAFEEQLQQQCCQHVVYPAMSTLDEAECARARPCEAL